MATGSAEMVLRTIALILIAVAVVATGVIISLHFRGRR